MVILNNELESCERRESSLGIPEFIVSYYSNVTVYVSVQMLIQYEREHHQDINL
jgi:hypothetical protein